MTRVELSHGLNGLFLLVFTFFAVMVTVLGLLVAVGAERIVAAGQGGSAGTYYVVGAVIALVGVFMMRISLRGMGSVAVIEIDDDRNWILRSRFGRALATVPPSEGRRFELRGQRLLVLAASVPKVQNVVDGTLFLRESHRRFRLAVSGPFTYDQALVDLGYDARAPRPGETRNL